MMRWLATLATFLGAAPVSALAAEITFYKDVQPILKRHCTICHSDQNVDELDTSGGVSFSNPEAILKNAKTPIVAVGQAEKSPLYQRLVHADAGKRMPKDDQPLAPEKIATIKEWIAAGCPIGKPVARGQRRQRQRPVLFRELSLDLNVNAPAGAFGIPKAGKLSLVARMAPLAPVTALAFSPSDKLLACGSFRRIVVWDLERGVAAAVLTDPLGMVHDLEFTPDGRILWCAGGDPAFRGELKAYQVGDFKNTITYDEPEDVLYALAISPAGKQLATVGYDRQLRIFELPGGKLQHTTKAHSDFAFAVAFAKDGKTIVTGGKDNAVKTWDAATGKSLAAFSGHNQAVLSVLFAPDGKTIYSSGHEPQIRKWDVAKGGEPRVQGGHGGIVYQMAWNRDWSRFVTCGSDRTVRLWKADASPEKTFSGPSEVVFSAALSPDGKLAAAGAWDGYVRVWEVASGRLAATFVSADRDDGKPPDWLAFSPQGFLSAAPTAASRVQFTVADTPVAFDKVFAVVGRPAEVAKGLRGAAPPPVSIPTPK